MAHKRNMDELNFGNQSSFATPLRRNERGDEAERNRVSRHHVDDDSTTKPGFLDHKQNTVIRGGQTSNFRQYRQAGLIN